MRDERGLTIIDMLVTLLLTSIVAGSITSLVYQSTNYYNDHRVKSEVEEQARMLLDVISYDVRMIGSGMPLGQSSFQMSDQSLGSAVLPVMVGATSSDLSVRLSEYGNQSVLTSAFDPAGGTLFNVSDPDRFESGDIVYISNVLLGEGGGVQAEVSNIFSDTIEIAQGAVYSSGITYPAGSEIYQVSNISYSGTQPAMRGTNGVLTELHPKASISFVYGDQSGVTLVTPLSRSQIADSLARITVTVTVESDRPLRETGELYTVTMDQTIVLRNMLLSRS